ncbi:MAG TPA: hypothetical protein VD860_17115 [Azospirillum sp.]|nr:hypothetical protein [Azospirillum sp.]
MELSTIDLIVRDVCELPGDDYATQPDDLLTLTERDLRAILESRLETLSADIIANGLDDVAGAALDERDEEIGKLQARAEKAEAENARLREAATYANYLINVIEGPFGWATCRSEHGMRLKDAPEYVAAYLKIRAANTDGDRPSTPNAGMEDEPHAHPSTRNAG